MAIPVIIQITQRIPIGVFVKSPSGRATFEIYHIDADRVMIKTGKKETIISIPASCFEDAPKFLRSRGWVRIGAIHGPSDENTFDFFVKQYMYGTSVASYVAPILEMSGIVEIDRTRPAKIKLIS